MTVSVDQAVDALSSLSRDDMLAAIEQAVGRLDPVHASEVGTLLRLALEQERIVESMAGAPSRVHNLVASAFRGLQIKAEARRRILAIDMLDSGAVGDALGAKGQNRREAASDLRRRGRIVGIPVNAGRFVFPAFQFDPVDQGVIAEVAAVNQVLDALADPWGVASWWISAHPRLDGAAPRDLVGTARRADLLTLAQSVSSE